MTAPLIVHIETATDICSVALSEGNHPLALAESGPERSHATLLNAFIRKVVAESDRDLAQIDAIAISKGPGSYTGLRIGVSTAKGIAYALKKPLLATGTLENMAYGARDLEEIKSLMAGFGNKLLICPMLDARRMEVYSAFYTLEMIPYREVAADIVDSQSYGDIFKTHHVCFLGNGADKIQEVLKHPHAHFIQGFHSSAQHMIEPVLQRYKSQQFEDVAYFEPFYLKDFIATIPKKKVL
jgi:tRNA threonylcarbamoyladenosine biosynthesis protein TsaB